MSGSSLPSCSVADAQRAAAPVLAAVNGSHSPISIALVQQGVWDTPLESMPLAMGYLKAVVLDDEELRKAVSPILVSFRGGESAAQMAETLFAEGCPDMVAFSVCGWNLFQFGAVSETFRQLNPEGWIVWGGRSEEHTSELQSPA